MVGGMRCPNDGMQLVEVLRRRGRMRQAGNPFSAHLSAQDALKGALPALRCWSVCTLSPWDDALGKVSASDLGAALLRWSSLPGTSSQERWEVLDGFATWALLQGKTDVLDVAEQLVDELIEREPTSWTLKGTKGGILIERGQGEEGARLLRELMKDDPSPFDRAISACFLGLAEAKQNRHQEAQKWLTVAKEIDGNTKPLKRIEALVATYREKAWGQCADGTAAVNAGRLRRRTGAPPLWKVR